MKLKKTYYQVSQQIDNNIYLCTNFNNNTHILLSEEVYSAYINDKTESNILTLQEKYPEVFKILVSNGFLIESETDETTLLFRNRKKEIEDKQMYHIVINPTLDCNLSCWYCYESRVAGSSMDIDLADAVLKNLKVHLDEQPYSLLKISFFGGEPFLRPTIIKHIIKGADIFCQKNKIGLFLDFTTNGTLCPKSIINLLKEFSCTFQITLDGSKEQHNKIKYTKSKKTDTFALTLKNIYYIQREIKNCHISVRINFDKNTLDNFDSILEALKDLDRSKTMIILKRIWQVNSNDIDQSMIFASLRKLFENNFVVDYYSQGGICFADRRNQVLINYDGNVFKCTTLTIFDKENALGYLDKRTGKIYWNEEKISYLQQDSIANICKKCRMLPSCGGFCKKKVSSNEDLTCFLTASNISIFEFALIQFYINLTKEKYEKDL